MPLPQQQLNQNNPITIPTIYYCDPGDLQRRLSILGIQLRTQDYNISGNSGEAGVIEDAIWDATETINYYCSHIYDAAHMVKSFWVNRRCTDIAVYILEMRRGIMPSSAITLAYKQAIDWLEHILNGTVDLPGVPMHWTAAPAWSNIRIDQRYSTFRIRVETPISDSSSAPYGQSVDWNSEFDFQT